MNAFDRAMSVGVIPAHKKLLKDLTHSRFTTLAKKDLLRSKKTKKG